MSTCPIWFHLHRSPTRQRDYHPHFADDQTETKRATNLTENGRAGNCNHRYALKYLAILFPRYRWGVERGGHFAVPYLFFWVYFEHVSAAADLISLLKGFFCPFEDLCILLNRKDSEVSRWWAAAWPTIPGRIWESWPSLGEKEKILLGHPHIKGCRPGISVQKVTSHTPRKERVCGFQPFQGILWELEWVFWHLSDSSWLTFPLPMGKPHHLPWKTFFRLP